MRIVGIDPALTVTGYGVIDEISNKVSLVEAGVIVTSARQPLSERLIKIYGAVHSLLSETKPSVVVLEKLYAHYRHPTTASVLGHARGVIFLACAHAKVPVIEYAATRVKKAVLGKGLAPKYQIQKMVTGVLKLRSVPRYNDVTDALALALAHNSIIRGQI
jgi:crossover junction endodeoxyribonuclease RuvC